MVDAFAHCGVQSVLETTAAHPANLVVLKRHHSASELAQNIAGLAKLAAKAAE
jgi:hypothetical protein